MTKNHDIAAPGNERNTRGETTPPAPVKTPRSVKRVAAGGIPVSLAAAAAVSFAGLTELGSFAGIQHPWLMPVAIDVYATTATLIAMLLPEGHRARRTAVWNARLGLAMSMSGNALARSLHLGTAGYTASDALLTFVGAWPSLIVERLLHLQGHLTVGESSAAEPATQAPPVPASSAPPALPSGATEKRATSARKRQPAGATVTDMGASGGLSLEEWAERAAPVYVELMDRNGAAPTAPKLMAELVQRGNPAVGPARARLVRKATEDRLGLSKDPDEESEPGDEDLQEAS